MSKLYHDVIPLQRLQAYDKSKFFINVWLRLDIEIKIYAIGEYIILCYIWKLLIPKCVMTLHFKRNKYYFIVIIMHF